MLIINYKHVIFELWKLWKQVPVLAFLFKGYTILTKLVDFLRSQFYNLKKKKKGEKKTLGLIQKGVLLNGGEM